MCEYKLFNFNKIPVGVLSWTSSYVILLISFLFKTRWMFKAVFRIFTKSVTESARMAKPPAGHANPWSEAYGLSVVRKTQLSVRPR